MATTAVMSGLQFDALPYEEGRRWELLEGDLIEVPSPTLRHRKIVFALQAALNNHLRERKIEGIVSADVEFALAADIRLRPDVCVLLPEKAGQLDEDRSPIPGAPDLAIEVISPSERTTESQAKVWAYLRNGVAEVWQIYPRLRTIEIFKSESHRTLGAHQPLTTDLLPGFSEPSRPS